MPKRKLVHTDIKELDSLERMSVVNRLLERKWGKVSDPFELLILTPFVIELGGVSTGCYYSCCQLRYKSQRTRLHIVASPEYLEDDSYAMKKFQSDDKIWSFKAFLTHYFDKEYMRMNKKTFFRYPEYVLNFSCIDAIESDRSMKYLCRFLNIPKKHVKEERNYVCLWDSFPSISRVLRFHQTPRRLHIDYIFSSKRDKEKYGY